MLDIELHDVLSFLTTPGFSSVSDGTRRRLQHADHDGTKITMKELEQGHRVIVGIVIPRHTVSPTQVSAGLNPWRANQSPPVDSHHAGNADSIGYVT
jgi:hypothetical protein